jgi:hypothetical protein
LTFLEARDAESADPSTTGEVAFAIAADKNGVDEADHAEALG